MSRGYCLADEVHAHVAMWLEGRGSSIVVELGSGAGTPKLRERIAPHRLISIEHSNRFEEFCDVYAPLKGNWYHPAVLRRKLPEQIDLVIVDGPPGTIGRNGLLDHLDLFPDRVPMLIDDVHREAEMRMALWLSKRRYQAFTVHPLSHGRAYATMGMR